MTLPTWASIAAVVALAGCTCGDERKRDRRRETAAADDAAAEPASEPPPPAVKRTEGAAPGPSDPRFGVASITFRLVEGRPHAQVSVAIPEGASIQDAAVQPASVYFDHGPPIQATLTAREGAWRSQDIRLPTVVTSAQEATLRIPTVPQTTFKWAMGGAWSTAATGPVTLDTGRGGVGAP